MTPLVYISRNYKFSTNAASKPKTDCESILNSIGFKNLGFKQTQYKSSALGAIISFLGISKGLFILPYKSTICIQYPLSKFYKLITKIAVLKKCTIILIVHDVKSLMGKNKHIAQEMKKFSCANTIIIHNHSMAQWFINHGSKANLIPLYMFDYLSNNNDAPELGNKAQKIYDIVFAGGLGYEKSAFLYKLDEIKNSHYKLKLYGNGFNKDVVNKTNSILEYQGRFSPEEVSKHIKGSFGLVWNGNAIEECAGNFGNYLLYNNPHKTSLYLLCGLPIIIWEKAAIASFIKKEGLGICISSLAELNFLLQNLNTEEYQLMLNNVTQVRKKIMSGGFLKDAVKRALEKTT